MPGDTLIHRAGQRRERPLIVVEVIGCDDGWGVEVMVRSSVFLQEVKASRLSAKPLRARVKDFDIKGG